MHNNPDLTEIDKFNYLYSLLEGPGLRAIQGLTITAENYKSAVDILNERFGKTQQVISAHMDKLLKLPTCNGRDSSQLRHDQVSVNVRGLIESLGVKAEQYGSLLIPVIMSKLPEDVRMQIARNSSNEVWKIEDLLKLIKQEVEAREVCENVKANDLKLKGGSSDHSRRNIPTAASLLAGWSNPKGQGIQCAYCRKSHYSASCEQFREIDTRKNILKRDGRCFRCLGLGIEQGSVILPKKCHIDPPETSSVKQDPKKSEPTKQSGQKGKRDHEVTMVNRNSPRNNQSRRILLQTECTVALSQDGRDSIPVRVLLDSGSSNNPSMTHLIIAKENPWLMNNPYHEDESKALTYQLGKFWEVGSIGIQNDDSLTANKEFLREIRYNDSENRYEVNLPWKSGQIPRSNGYISCVNRLRQLHRNLKGNEELLCEYNKVI